VEAALAGGARTADISPDPAAALSTSAFTDRVLAHLAQRVIAVQTPGSHP
jgi:hypothetical protein